MTPNNVLQNQRSQRLRKELLLGYSLGKIWPRPLFFRGLLTYFQVGGRWAPRWALLCLFHQATYRCACVEGQAKICVAESRHDTICCTMILQEPYKHLRRRRKVFFLWWGVCKLHGMNLSKQHLLCVANSTALCIAVWLWSWQVADCLLHCSQVLLLVVKQIFPDFEFMWLVEEAKKNLPLELDFLNEGRNAEKVAHMLRNFDFLKVREYIFSCMYVR